MTATSDTPVEPTQRIEIVGVDGEVTVFEGNDVEFVTGPFGMKFVFEVAQSGERTVLWSEPLGYNGVRGVITVSSPTEKSLVGMRAAGLL